MKICPKCSHTLDDSVMKCSYCGYDFTKAQYTEVEDIKEGETAYNAQHAVPVSQQNTDYQYNQGYQNYQAPQGGQGYQGDYAPYTAPQVKYCPHCGNQCDINAVLCVKCGAAFAPAAPAYDDRPSGWLKFLSFIIPLAGLILYLTEKDKRPRSAKAYGKMALISFIIGIVLSILYTILIFVGAIALASDPYIEYGIEEYYYSFISLISSLR